jgi:hypothetical protein
MPVDEVESRIAVLLDDPGEPTDKGGYRAGSIEGREFAFGFDHGSGKSHQYFHVTGRIQDDREFRVVRLRLRARDPWIGWWFFLFLVVYASGYAYANYIPPKGVVFSVALVLALYAFVHLLLGPDLATDRVAARVARAVRGSVHVRGRWVVPDPE